MAKIRIGIGSDFRLKDQKLGLGENNPQERLDVAGVAKGQDLKVTGISSLTAYEGFLRADHQITENTTLTFDQGPVSSLSGEIIVGTGQTVTVNEVVKETAGVGNGSGDQWFDINGNHAFKTNGDPTWDGSAFVYDGTGDYHSLSGGDTSTFEVGSSNFTLEQWVNITANSSIVGTFFSKGNDNSVGTNFMSLQTTGANTTPGFFFGSGVALLSGSSVGTGGWHHYVVTRSGNNFTLYVDGTSVDTATSSSSLASGITGGINIGAQSYSVSTDGRKLNGKISITRLYSGRVLTAAEVTSNYNAGHTATTSAVAATVDLNANNPASYPGTVRDVDTTDVTRAGGSEVECLKVFNTFTPPSGGTNERPYAPKPGELYYNYDFKTIEFFDGYGWRQVDNTTRSGRAVFAGGYITGDSRTKEMILIQIHTRGNATYFGDLANAAATDIQGVGSEVRGVLTGGYDGGRTTAMDYITIASEGNGIDFGNLTVGRNALGSASSSTRGLAAGGNAGSNAINTIDYIQISTLGDALEFGDLTNERTPSGGISSPTRGVFGSGDDYAPGWTGLSVRTLDYSTFASKGNAVDFGEDSAARITGNGCGNGIRGCWAGGYIAPTLGGTASAIMEGGRAMTYVTIASTGNAIEFGTLTMGSRTYIGASSTKTRGIFTGGSAYPVHYNEIDYIQFASLGDSLDFGDLPREKGYMTGSVSDSHGGLGGF